MALGSKTKQRREELGLTQEQLARKVGVTQSAIYQLERRDSTTFRNIIGLAEALGVEPEWLIGRQSADVYHSAPGKPTPDNSQPHSYIAPEHDDIEVPVITEVEMSAGSSRTEVQESPTSKIRLSRSTLGKAGVTPSDAACVIVRGDSMEPAMPDGTIAGVNTADKIIRDGKFYAFDHDGQLRIKRLKRLPEQGLRVISLNSEYEPEDYDKSSIESGKIKIIGRVFWYSALV